LFNYTKGIMSKKILIIKTGYSEIFTETKDSKICSLGDVLRTSFILNFYKEEEVDWLTSETAIPLINMNKVHNVYSEIQKCELSKYDLIINLEKNNENSELIKTRNTLGFIYEGKILMVRTYIKTMTFVEFLEDVNHEESTFQEKLCKLLGHSWNLEEYSLNAPRNNTSVKVGFNWKAGSKWPTKQLPQLWWNDLEVKLDLKDKVSWQEGFNNLSEYIEWIDSCETLVTLDSLGLHIALALKKKVVVLFGPTNHKHVELYNLGSKVCYNMETNKEEIMDNVVKLLRYKK
jgi:heptosyltransferase-2